MFDRQVMGMIYKKAKSPNAVPWHSETTTKFLGEALGQRKERGRALDIGCGTGVFSALLAKNGFEVTGIDLIPEALEMAKERAKADKVRVDFVEADILSWKPSKPFDLIFDSGCLHALIGGNLTKYKEQVVSWAANNSDYVLCHWGRRNALDWRPIGPRRRTREELVRLFEPEFIEKAHEEEIMTNVPMPFGPTVLALGLWFKYQPKY